MLSHNTLSIILAGLFSLSEMLPVFTRGNTHGILHFIILCIKKLKNIKNNSDNNTVDENSNLLPHDTETNTEVILNKITKETDVLKQEFKQELEKQLNDTFIRLSNNNDINSLRNILSQDIDLSLNIKQENLKHMNNIANALSNISDKTYELSDKTDELSSNVHNQNQVMTKMVCDKIKETNAVLEKLEKCNFDSLQSLNDLKNSIQSNEILEKCIKISEDIKIILKNNDSQEMLDRLKDLEHIIKNINLSNSEEMLEMILEYLQEVQRKNVQVANNEEYKHNLYMDKFNILLNVTENKINDEGKITDVLNKHSENINKHISELRSYISNEMVDLNGKIDVLKKKKNF